MTEKITCYSDGEGRFMTWSQEFRGRWLSPMLGGLAHLGMRANHVTLLSLIAGIAFCPALLLGQPVVAFVLLALHILLDGLDGPLARFRQEASSRGSFTDTMADQVVVTFTTLALVQGGWANPWAGGLYVFLYAIVVGFALVRNAMAAPYSWLFRPRFLVFGWAAIELFLWHDTLDTVLWFSVVLLSIKTLTGFRTIRRNL